MSWLAILTNKYVAGALALTALCAGLWFGGDAHGRRIAQAQGDAALATLRADYAQASAKAAEDARAQQTAAQDRIAAIDAQHAQELQHAKQDADRVITDLRAGTLRLRQQWRGCPPAAGVFQTAAGAGQPDAAADQRAAGARDLVRIAAEADAQVRALQAVIRADRQ